MEWYKEYFSKRWMKFRDSHALAERAQSEVGFLQDVLQIVPPARVLDVGCGFGQHSVEFAAKGFDVTGLDLSADLLDEAKNLSKSRNVKVQWVMRDMRLIDYSAEYDGIISLFTSFGYFESEEENFDVLRRMSKALLLGGRLVLDDENREGLLMRYLARDWYTTKGGDLVVEERRFDCIEGRGHTKIVLVTDGRTEEHNLSIRWYSIPELV